MTQLFSKVKSVHLFCLGIAALSLVQIPMLLLGTDSIVPYHDQLDGEIIAYIYQAKYLFSGKNIIPEFLNGVPKTALTPPAPLAVIFFRFFPAFTAYTVLQIMGQLIAFSGMFFLLKRRIKNIYISFLCSCLYAFLPFLPVYGLAQFGIPMLLLCFDNLYRKEKITISYVYIVFYSAMSSLVLIGFTWLIIGVFFTIHTLSAKSIRRHKFLLFAFIIMLIVYLAENFSLIIQLFDSKSTFLSHKDSYVIEGTDFVTELSKIFTSSSYYVNDFHIWIVPIASVALILPILVKRRLANDTRQYVRWLIIILSAILSVYILAALWNTSFIVSIRRHFGALKAFRFERILWCTPALWYIALAISLSIFVTLKEKAARLSSLVLSIIVVLSLCWNCFKSTTIKPCIQTLLQPEYNALSWSDYMALGVMEQVETFIETKENKTIDEYKVASLGIDPCAALYHGFYCVDGYSNNYPLSYKQTFREIIAPELLKSEYLTAYYDDWGNRCYLYSAEFPAYFTIGKGMAYYKELQLNTAALKAIGCDYILSAAYIFSADEMNLTLLNDTPLETENSYYGIYVYKINE